MKRSIVQHGSSSLTITLPIKLTEKFKLRKGDEIEVEESGPLLIISTGGSGAALRKEVSTTEHGIFTKNNLSHLYQLGYDDVIINYDDTTTLEEIRKRVPSCIGFEIIDQKRNSVHIRCIATTLEAEFDTLLRKAFLITKEMAEGIIDSLEQKETDRFTELRAMESLNNKFTDVCIRILSKRGYKIQNRTMQMYGIIKDIERIADEYKHLCDLLTHNKGDKEMLQAITAASEYFFTFYALFYKFDPALKKKIYEQRSILTKKFFEQMRTAQGPRSIVLHHTSNIVEKTFDAAGGYFALIL